MRILDVSKGLAAASLAAIGLAATAPAQPAQAQPYDYDSSNGGQITVYAPRVERDPATGAEVDVARESRVVYYGDLDLGSRHGVRVLHERVRRAAANACTDLAMRPGLVIIDSDNDSDCINRAVYRAMAQAPIAEDLAYSEYGYRYGYDYRH